MHDGKSENRAARLLRRAFPNGDDAEAAHVLDVPEADLRAWRDGRRIPLRPRLSLLAIGAAETLFRLIR